MVKNDVGISTRSQLVFGKCFIYAFATLLLGNVVKYFMHRIYSRELKLGTICKDLGVLVSLFKY